MRECTEITDAGLVHLVGIHTLGMGECAPPRKRHSVVIQGGKNYVVFGILFYSSIAR
jgi:hypothetical protein